MDDAFKLLDQLYKGGGTKVNPEKRAIKAERKARRERNKRHARLKRSENLKRKKRT